MAKNTTPCPKCGLELPDALLTVHVVACDEGGDVTTDEQPTESFPSLGEDGDDLFPDVLSGGTMDEREGGGGVMEPDLDDEFARLVGSLDLSDIGPELTDVNVTTLDDAELSLRFNQVREELMSRGEMINPTTQTGRDLHSSRAAYIIEMRRRGLA